MPHHHRLYRIRASGRRARHRRRPVHVRFGRRTQYGGVIRPRAFVNHQRQIRYGGQFVVIVGAATIRYLFRYDESAQFGHAPLPLFNQSVQRRPANFRVRRVKVLAVMVVRAFDEALGPSVMVDGGHVRRPLLLLHSRRRRRRRHRTRSGRLLRSPLLRRFARQSAVRRLRGRGRRRIGRCRRISRRRRGIFFLVATRHHSRSGGSREHRYFVAYASVAHLVCSAARRSGRRRFFRHGRYVPRTVRIRFRVGLADRRRRPPLRRRRYRIIRRSHCDGWSSVAATVRFVDGRQVRHCRSVSPPVVCKQTAKSNVND